MSADKWQILKEYSSEEVLILNTQLLLELRENLQ